MNMRFIFNKKSGNHKIIFAVHFNSYRIVLTTKSFAIRDMKRFDNPKYGYDADVFNILFKDMFKRKIA